jgi:hypothetical protein
MHEKLTLMVSSQLHVAIKSSSTANCVPHLAIGSDLCFSRDSWLFFGNTIELDTSQCGSRMTWIVGVSCGMSNEVVRSTSTWPYNLNFKELNFVCYWRLLVLAKLMSSWQYEALQLFVITYIDHKDHSHIKTLASITTTFENACCLPALSIP